MAPSSVLRICSVKAKNIIVNRIIKCTKDLSGFHHYSTSNCRFQAENPVKFTTTNASKITFKESSPFQNEPEDEIWWKPVIHIISLCVFMIYFCILREENDLDEKLRGNEKYQDDTVKLLNLKMKLMYCEQNKLPTAALKNKIEEIQNRLNMTK